MYVAVPESQHHNPNGHRYSHLQSQRPPPASQSHLHQPPSAAASTSLSSPTSSSFDRAHHPYASAPTPPSSSQPTSATTPGGAANLTTMPPNLPNPPPATTTMVNGRIYSLDVVQQPVRARMCGFGDKDRRPITPPPCVRLIVKDANNDTELDVNEINMDFFVLTVDLWSADGSREVNLVRHSATSPSISTAVSSSYPPPPQTPQPAYSYNPNSLSQYQTSYSAPVPLMAPSGVPDYAAQQRQQQQLQVGGQAPPQSPQHHQHGPHQGYYQQQYPSQPPPGQPGIGPSQQPPSPTPSGMFTRNLIGSLSASAFRLTDPDMKMGVWFILQDLSVRTEGTFRLKMNFVNVGASPPSSPAATASSPNQPSGTQTPTGGAGGLNTGSAPVLASCFSDVFQVFSAKKFPGVIESTNLSKCFATQGIKIPIRKDGPKALSNREEYDNDD